jgi:nucleoid-associated protein YgaU
MMRKDVQIGFAVGGIFVAILIVYVLAVSGGKKKSEKVALVETPTAEQAKDATSTDSSPPTTAPSSNDPFKSSDSLASTDHPAPSVPPEQAKPNASEEDKWMMALSKGSVPPMLTSTPAPDATAKSEKPATATPPPAAGISGTNVPAPTEVTSTPARPLEVASAPATQPSRSTASAPAGSRTHVVQAGETITKIAEAAYGSANFFPHILRANPNVDAKRMRPGTVLVLPAESEVKAGLTASGSTEKAEANPSSPLAVSRTTVSIDPKTQYEVQPGDSLQKISIKLYGSMSKWQSIYDLNKALIGSDPAKVKVKQVLKLPEPPTVKAAA